MSLIRKHGAVLQAWACLDLVVCMFLVFFRSLLLHCIALFCFWAHVSVFFFYLCVRHCFFVNIIIISANHLSGEGVQ